MSMPPALRRLLTPVPDPLLRHLMYRRRFGRWGDFTQPARFTEHMVARMLYDRIPELAWTCDKRSMKFHAERQTPWVRVPETLWHGEDLSLLDLEVLPDRWVIKPNHACKAVFFGDRSTTLPALRRATRGWLRMYDRAAVGEWAYRTARRELIVEPMIGGGAPLADFKLYVFHGCVRVLHRDVGRFTDDFGEVFFTPRWEPLEICNGAPRGDVGRPPASLAEMVRAAEVLGGDYEFMRVDFYDVDGVPWFGELTPYPSGGMDPFEPDLVDLQLGAWWSGQDIGSPEPMKISSPREMNAREHGGAAARIDPLSDTLPTLRLTDQEEDDEPAPRAAQTADTGA